MKTTVAILVLAATILVAESHTSIDDVLVKCHLKDDVCMKKLVKNVVPRLATGGIIGIDVKPVDPVEMSLSVSILDLFEFSMVNANATGAKNCEYVSVDTHIERGYADMHIKCKVEFDGDFKVASTSPYLKKLLGDKLNYAGTGKLTFEDLNIFFRIIYHARKNENGEIYLRCESDKLTHTYMYNGGVEFEPETIFAENQKAKNFYVNFLEEHRSILKASIGDAYVGKVRNFYAEYQQALFDVVPAKKYIIDDLTPYVKEY